MNLPTVQKVQLPAHLQHLQGNQQLMSVNASAAAGMSAGAWPRISIRGARFHLVDASGEELHVPDLHLDVVVVDANPYPSPSKRYYPGKFDPNSEGGAPECFSDNGVGPSTKATKPQHVNCATCPHNAWGSKISEASGKPVKACTDLKKVAVLIAANTSGPVMELDIPAASLTPWAQYIEKLNKHGVPAAAIVTRLTFDPSASFPKLVFNPASDASGQLAYITTEQAADVMDVIGTEEVDQCTGKNDRPVDPTKVIIAPIAQNPVAPQPAYNPPPPPAPPQAAFPPLPPSAPAGFPPVPAAAGPASAPTLHPAGTPDAPPAAKRTRRAKAPADAPVSEAPAPSAAPPPFVARMPAAQNAANTAVPVNVPVADAALEDMLQRALQV